MKICPTVMERFFKRRNYWPASSTALVTKTLWLFQMH